MIEDRRLPLGRKGYELAPVRLKTNFDLELFLSQYGARELDPVADQVLEEYAEAVQASLRAVLVRTLKREYLLVWLETAMERRVDEMWGSSPSAAYALDALLRSALMRGVSSLLAAPQARCRPLPAFDNELEAALAELGLLPYQSDAMNRKTLTLAARYAVLTFFSESAGCADCALVRGCPHLA